MTHREIDDQPLVGVSYEQQCTMRVPTPYADAAPKSTSVEYPVVCDLNDIALQNDSVD
jgi:hypothetical protein